MSKIKFLLVASLVFSMFTISCDSDSNDIEINEVEAPTNLEVSAQIVGATSVNSFGNGSGQVIFSATAENARSYEFVFDDITISSASGNVTFGFTDEGINTYIVEVIASNGIDDTLNITRTLEIEVAVDLENIPETTVTSSLSGLLIKLTGSDDPTISSSKTWRIKKEGLQHFGLGPVGGIVQDEFFGSAPNEKEGVGMYDDRYIFNSNGTFTHITNPNNDNTFNTIEDTVFGRVDLIDELGPHNITPNGGDIENYPLEDYTAEWSIINEGREASIHLSDLGFIGYYTGGNHTYEIFDFNIDDSGSPANELILRTTDGNNEFDWWFVITSLDEGAEEAQVAIDVTYDNLIWSDEFNTDGTPNTNNWSYEIGNGCPDLCGWGNGEEQYYTDRSDNVYVSDGTLKIVAKRESLNGFNYTSTRMLTQDKFEFTFGRVEVRAKLPLGVGTWPAIWMLGANLPEVGWPAAGEIDIMEHVGRVQDEVSSALHTPSSFGNTVNTNKLTVDGVSEDFHIYGLNWSEDEISFLVDGEIHYQYNPNNKTAANWPFDTDQFLLLNLAMGGTLGGNIDSNFIESTMEVDYIRVYQ